MVEGTRNAPPLEEPESVERLPLNPRGFGGTRDSDTAMKFEFPFGGGCSKRLGGALWRVAERSGDRTEKSAELPGKLPEGVPSLKVSKVSR